jgi:hypothetical protein
MTKWESIMLRSVTTCVSLVAALGLGATPPSRLTFRGVFSGVDASSERLVWQGWVDGPTKGRVTVALGQVEEPAAAANPVWHVASRWSVFDDEGGAARSFAGDLEGMIDWKSGTIRLGGTITDGWSKGSWVEVDGRVVDGDLTGSLLVTRPRSRE